MCQGDSTTPTAVPLSATNAPTTQESRVFSHYGSGSFEQCREACEAADLQMPCIIGPLMDENLQKAAQEANLDTVWLGYQARPDMDPADVSSWDWQVGCPSFYNDWASGEPNDYGDGEECASMYGAGRNWSSSTRVEE